MNRSIFKSVRWKLILYSILSLICAALTEAALGVIIYIVSVGMGKSTNGYGMKSTQYAHNFDSNMGSSANSKEYVKINLFDKIQDVFGISGNMFIVIFVTVIISGVFFFVIYFMLFSRRVTLDLSYISEKIKNISNGDMAEKLDFNRDDEIGDIAESVNEMSLQIKSLMDSEREALKVNKDLITCVAHDLRTPITSVIGYLQLAVDEDKYSAEERKKYAAIATQKANRLEKMIQDLFSYTKIMSGEVKPQFCQIDLVKLVEQMIEEFYPILTDNELECSFYKDIDSLVINADPALIARAVSNLLSNAAKYGRDGKRIMIKLKLKDGNINLLVTNYGLVIPKDSIEHVFEKFYRVEDSRSLQTGGTGLGLNIAKEVIGLHGGSILVKSDIKGTTFMIVLPEEIIVKSDQE